MLLLKYYLLIIHLGSLRNYQQYQLKCANQFICTRAVNFAVWASTLEEANFCTRAQKALIYRGATPNILGKCEKLEFI